MTLPYSMSETKFTPGPWQWNPDGTMLFGPSFTIFRDARWWNGQDGDRHLIAAAPELFKALVNLLPCTSTRRDPRDPNSWSEEVDFWESEREQGRGSADDVLAAYAALRKARGDA